MSVNVKRNLILSVLSLAFFLSSKSGLEMTMTNDPSGFGVPLFVFAGMAFIGSTLALIVRLWGKD